MNFPNRGCKVQEYASTGAIPSGKFGTVSGTLYFNNGTTTAAVSSTEVSSGTDDPPTSTPTGAAMYYTTDSGKLWVWTGAAWLNILATILGMLVCLSSHAGSPLPTRRNLWTTNTTPSLYGAWTNHLDGTSTDAAPRLTRAGPAFMEFANSNATGTPWVSVGMLGTPEANLSFNMNYRDGVHRFYDTGKDAMWLALGENVWAIQQASNVVTTGDVWYANGTNYMVWGNSDGKIILRTDLSKINANTYDAILTVPRIGSPSVSIAGDTDLVIEGHRTRTTAGIIYLNAYNNGRSIINLGGGGVGIHTITDPGTNNVLIGGNLTIGTTNVAGALAGKVSWLGTAASAPTPVAGGLWLSNAVQAFLYSGTDWVPLN